MFTKNTHVYAIYQPCMSHVGKNDREKVKKCGELLARSTSGSEAGYKKSAKFAKLLMRINEHTKMLL